MTVAGFRLSQLQVHLGTEQGKDEGATLCPAFLGPSVSLELGSGMPLNQWLLGRQLTSHPPHLPYIHAPKSRPTNLGPSSDHEAPHNLAPTPRSYITEQSCLPRDPEGDTPIYVPKAGLLILV